MEVNLTTSATPHLGKERAAVAWRALLGLALAAAALHIATNGAYGFHRDELQVLDDARHLTWGLVAYPPFTPAIERLGLDLFGLSLRWLRLWSVLAQALVLLFSGMITAELGGSNFAQITAALAVAASGLPMFSATEFQYTSFDLLWMTALVYCLARILRRGNERWWIAAGLFGGLGLETKYSMVFYLGALALALALTPARRNFRSRWLWYGLGLAFAIALPNIVWQAQHGWISFYFLRYIHARDLAIGRTRGYWPQQFTINSPLFAAPLTVAGAIWFFLPAQRRFRPLGLIFALIVVGLWLAKARGYYAAAVYPMVLAAGAVWWESALRRLPKFWPFAAQAATVAVMVFNAVMMALFILPLGPVSSSNYALRHNGNLREEVGWNELAAETARIWRALPAAERAHAAILTFNYGETGAIDLLGRRYGLPPAISPVNSAWYRGYGSTPPQTEIILGLSARQVNASFGGCRLAGHNGNRYGIHNEESDAHPDIFICGPLRQPWAPAWREAQMKSFG